jgi:capsular exopolysaccharide synthesis family protein
MYQATENNQNKSEFSIRDFLRILLAYKWFIGFISLVSIMLSNYYLYFEPKLYSTYGVVEVKTYDKSLSDDLLQNTFYTTNKEIDKEIELFKIFDINKKVIEEMNFQVEVFVEDKYKKIELYGDKVPIEIKDINITDNQIIGKMIKLIPEKDGYSLEIEHMVKDRFLNAIFNKKLIKFSTNKKMIYNKSIKTDYFQLLINKKVDKLNKPIYFKLRGDTRSIFENVVKNRLTVEQLNPDAPLISISYEDNIPQRATEYVDRLVKAFLDEEMITKGHRSAKILKVIVKQLAETKKKLRNSENKLKEYKIKNNMVNPTGQSSLIINTLGKIDEEILQNKIKKEFLENIVEILNSGASLDNIGPFLIEIGDKATLDLIAYLEKLKFRESELQSEYTNEYPELLILQKQILKIREKVFSNIKNLNNILINKINKLKKRKVEQTNIILRFPKNEITLVNLTRDYDVNNNMYAYLLKKKSEQEVINSAVISDYKYVDKPYNPTTPIKPKRNLIQILSLAFGIFIGIILALLHNFLSNKIRDINDISGLSIYGIIPYIKKKKGRKIEVFDNPQSNYTENFRKLRTDLILLSKSKSSNIILITSMTNGEGKSTILANLSAILQLSGYKTVVIDLDLRKPSLDKFFDIDYGVGISSYLSGTANLSDIIFPTTEPGLEVIPAGPIPLNPSELILSDKIIVMLEKLKESYDYILIDSSPIGSLKDSLILMKHVDINLVIFRVNMAKKIYINKLEKMIDKYNLKNIGLILNSVNSKHIQKSNIL